MIELEQQLNGIRPVNNTSDDGEGKNRKNVAAIANDWSQYIEQYRGIHVILDQINFYVYN